MKPPTSVILCRPPRDVLRRGREEPGRHPAPQHPRLHPPARNYKAARPRSPATDAQAAADRATQEAALTIRVKRIDNAQESKIRELDDLPDDPASSPETSCPG